MTDLVQDIPQIDKEPTDERFEAFYNTGKEILAELISKSHMSFHEYLREVEDLIDTAAVDSESSARGTINYYLDLTAELTDQDTKIRNIFYLAATHKVIEDSGALKHSFRTEITSKSARINPDCMRLDITKIDIKNHTVESIAALTSSIVDAEGNAFNKNRVIALYYVVFSNLHSDNVYHFKIGEIYQPVMDRFITMYGKIKDKKIAPTVPTEIDPEIASIVNEFQFANNWRNRKRISTTNLFPVILDDNDDENEA